MKKKENISLSHQAKRIVNRLTEYGYVLTTAESCTGGQIAGTITQIPGASHILDRGFVTYSNLAKIEMLAVSPALIKEFGAVSTAVARAMVLGALKFSNADIAVAVTGVAGPGASEQKPAGTVIIASAIKETNAIRVENYMFSGNRLAIQQQSISAAFHHILAQADYLDCQ